ncbi:MAG: hypothetical protein EXS37_14230 [Opitutus sp.]|nr:hypothetical protein [Opitutus sp.]
MKTELGENLHSCCLYGSAVRGNAVEGVSDLNLLIVVVASTPAAHQAIARALVGQPQVNPFILGQPGFARSARAFAPKFASIRRHHRLLSGVDPFTNLTSDPQLERFLCEQALRNLRLRMVYSFVTRSRHKKHDRFLIGNTTAMFVQFSEALRLGGVAIPTDFAARIPVFEREFSCEGQVLRDLLALKGSPRRFSESDSIQWHERLFPVVEGAVHWIEKRWDA